MFGIGETELVIILLFGFMLFGPDKLPGMGRTIGRALRQFRSAQEGFTKVVQTEVIDPATEAMNMSATKPNRDRAAEIDDEDADIEGGEDQQAQRKKPTETFAERKARLAAERKAREEAAAAEAAAKDAEAEDEKAAEGDADADADAAASVDQPAAEQKAEDEAEAEPSTVSDLYALSTKRRKSSRRKAAEEKAAEEAAKAAAEAEEAASAQPDSVEEDLDGHSADAPAASRTSDEAFSTDPEPSDETSSPALESDNANATGEEDGSEQA